MTKYRKKPVVIEATQWFKMGDHLEVVEATLNGMPIFWIETLEGGHIVTIKDWIITGVKGEHYPCKPDIFEMTYELAQPEQEPGLVDFRQAALSQPPLPVQPEERNFCSTCGKRTADLAAIHTCTPPQRKPLNWEPIQEFWRNNSNIDWDELESAIKQALKEKNHG